MNEFWSSLVAWYKERTTSSLYGTYVISFLVWNWQIVYTYLFQAKGVIQIPTVEYIQTKLLFFSGTHIWYKQTLNDFWIIIPPMFFTFLIIRFVPRANNWAFNLNTNHFYQRKFIEDAASLNYEKSKNKNLQNLVEIKQEQTKSKIEIQKNISNEERWDEDYERFKKINFAYKFSKIIESYYKRRGAIIELDGYNDKVLFEIPEDILAYAHSNGIIEIDQKTNTIDTTAKGKYFINKFLEDPDKPVDIPF